MSNIQSFHKTHTVMWAIHGASALFLGLFALVTESLFTSAFEHMQKQSGLEFLELPILIVSVLFSYKYYIIVYGLCCCLFISMYHYKPQASKLVMYTFLLLHLPLSYLASAGILNQIDTESPYYLSVLISSITSELTLVIALAVSFFFVMKNTTGQTQDTA